MLNIHQQAYFTASESSDGGLIPGSYRSDIPGTRMMLCKIYIISEEQCKQINA